MAEVVAQVISVKHFADRTTRGEKKEECVVLNYKIGTDVRTDPQLAVLYPKQNPLVDVQGLKNLLFLDEVVVYLEPDPNNTSRNRVSNVLPVSVPA